MSGQWTVSDWSPDQTKILTVESISINESYLHVIEIATGKTETLTPRPGDAKAERVSNSEARWSKSGKSIYYITDKGSEFRQLVRLHLDSGDLKNLSRRIPWDIEEFNLSHDGEWLAWVANKGGTSSLGILESGKDELAPPETGLRTPESPELPPLQLPADGLDQQVALADDGIVSGLEFRPGKYEFGFTFTSARSPADAISYEKSGPQEPTTTRWTKSETGGLDAQGFAEPKVIEYASFDGRKIPAYVYRPASRKFPGPRPVLIDIHGGPEGQTRPGFIGRLNYLIDELGLVLIFPNVRGSSGYGKSYVKLDNGKLRGDSVKDVGALLDWIARQPDLDKSRVGVTGGSYGGFMSLAVQANYNDRIRCGIDIVGISNFVTFLQNTQGYRRDLRRAEYGDERDPEMRAYLEKVSPLSSADKIRTPILVVQGQNDPRVPISEAEQMLAALRKNGMPVWYVVGKNEGHGFAKKANQDYLQAVEVEFLRRYLLGGDKAESPKLGKRFPVSGTVRVDGKPLASGTIAIHPTQPGGHAASGTILGGAYILRTIEADDGALPGTYKVTLVSQEAGTKLPASYGNPDTTALRCEIRPSRNIIDFDIKGE